MRWRFNAIRAVSEIEKKAEEQMSAISATNCTHRGMAFMAAGSAITNKDYIDRRDFLYVIRS